MTMGKGKGAIQHRRAWRNKAFAKLGNRSLVDVEKNLRSDVLRRVLRKKALHKGG